MGRAPGLTDASSCPRNPARYAAGLAAPERSTEIRYEQLADGPSDVAGALATALELPVTPLAAVLSQAHAQSVGRYREQLTVDQQDEVEEESGELLAALGYLQ